MIILADVLGWVGNVFFVIGAIFLARKRPLPCCITNIIANSIYIAVGIMSNISSLWAISIFLLILAIVGTYTWSKHGEN
jgi:hypothetical protein